MLTYCHGPGGWLMVGLLADPLPPLSLGTLPFPRPAVESRLRVSAWRTPRSLVDRLSAPIIRFPSVRLCSQPSVLPLVRGWFPQPVASAVSVPPSGVDFRRRLPPRSASIRLGLISAGGCLRAYNVPPSGVDFHRRLPPRLASLRLRLISTGGCLRG